METGDNVRKYTEITKNLLKHLKKDKKVFYNSLLMKVEDNKLVISAKMEDQEMELFYTLEEGGLSNLSIKKLKDMVSRKEKPDFTARVRK